MPNTTLFLQVNLQLELGTAGSSRTLFSTVLPESLCCRSHLLVLDLTTFSYGAPVTASEEEGLFL